jgi:hypothetical protein
MVLTAALRGRGGGIEGLHLGFSGFFYTRCSGRGERKLSRAEIACCYVPGPARLGCVQYPVYVGTPSPLPAQGSDKDRYQASGAYH